MIFVFGSNLAGKHGAGAAKEAHTRGFPYYLGSGYSNNCYAIPTKDCSIITLPVYTVALYVAQFIEFAENYDAEFQVTRIGCGLAGFHDDQIAPLFEIAPPNCYFDTKWRHFLPRGTRFWGTY